MAVPTDEIYEKYLQKAIGEINDLADEIARAAGDTSMVVSATPSLNTVRFYLGQGYAPMEEPLPELFELEPEDIHMEKPL